jgi:outer membrane receptor protein involved in Fe transport
MGTLGIVDFRYEVPTGNLAPEKTRNVELGYKFQSGKVTASASGYYMHLHNLITRVKVEGEVINGYPVYKKENVEEAYIKGLETEVRYEVSPRWQVKGNIAYAYGQNLTKNEPLRRIPPLNARLMSTYHRKRLFGSAEILFSSKQDRLAQGDIDDNRIPEGGTPAWNVINLYGGYELTHLKFNLAFQNIFNADYRTHGSGINGVGRSVWLSVMFTL